MKIPLNRLFLPTIFKAIHSIVFLVAFSTVFCVNDVSAQSVLAPIKNPNDTSAFEISRTKDKTLTSRSGVNPYQLGPIVLTPRLNYLYTTADGLGDQNGQQRDTTIQSISPGFLLNWGSNWNLDYSPTWSFYSEDSFEDSLSHNASLSGSGSIDDWIISFAQSYQYTLSSLVSTGRQTGQDTWNTSLSGTYQLNQSMLLNLGASQNLTYTTSFTDTEQRGLSTSLSYQRSQTTNYAFNLAAGRTKINPGFDLDYHQITVSGDWQPTENLGISVQGGIDSSKFDYSGAPSIDNPIFGASLRYQAAPETALILSANRDVSASLFQNQISEQESYSASIRQRFLGRFYVVGSVTRSYGRYVDETGDDQNGRDDEQDTYSLGVSTNLNDKISLSGTYRYSDNFSNTNDFNFESNQYTFQASYQY